MRSAPSISTEKHRPAYRRQSAFLMKANKKHDFVELLVHHLEENGVTVLQQRMMLTLTFHTALNITANGTVTVVANDTNVLVLLVHHFKPDMCNIFMLSEITRLRNVRLFHRGNKCCVWLNWHYSFETPSCFACTFRLWFHLIPLWAW